MNDQEPLQTPLVDWHRSHGARMMDFAGWLMPIQYSTIVEEHHAVRKHVGLFDISHMGRLSITGPAATEFLNGLVTLDVSRLTPGRIRYALATNEQGGIRDDILISRTDDGYQIVVNASNREKIVNDWGDVAKAFEVTFTDHTFETAMIALQGPEAEKLICQDFPEASELKYYRFSTVLSGNDELTLSRTGYTGEDGFEVIGPIPKIVSLWDKWITATNPAPLPCGLGCRDTLRLEAAMPLYGHELSEDIDPLSAGLDFAVNLDKEFRGCANLRRVKEQGPSQVRIGMSLEGKRIAREGAEIVSSSGEHLGNVTSGTFSPTLQQSIAMGYVLPSASEAGTNLAVVINGKNYPAVVSSLPFFKRPKN